MNHICSQEVTCVIVTKYKEDRAI